MTSRPVMDDISALYFLLPSCASDVIVQHGLNANSPEAAKKENSHLIVKKRRKSEDSQTVRGTFFEKARYFKTELQLERERARPESAPQ
jgi:hypothetical protein